MKYSWILPIVISASPMANAGGDSAPAKIVGVNYLAEGKIVFQIAWTKESGFIDGTKQTKVRFDYNRGSQSLSSKIPQLLKAGKAEDRTAKTNFEKCANWLIESFKTGSEVEIGQTGGGRFAVAEDQADQVIIPHARFTNTVSGKQVCLFTNDSSDTVGK